MNYNEIIEYITEKNKLGSVPGLTVIKELLRRLGNPENRKPVIHIAGTNGKGSIMSYLESILIESGYMAGRYISPAIFDYRERFQINREYISREKCAHYISIVAEQVENMILDGFPSPTSFEIETAAAFLYFAEENVDIMLIECGMGGRLDATNVFEKPMVNIISSISRDHMNFLGETLKEITNEKLGILKPGAVCASYPNNSEVMGYIRDKCANLGIKSFIAAPEQCIIESESLDGTLFKYKGTEYETGLIGDFQVYNAITAIEAANAFNLVCERYGLHKVSISDIKNGIANAVWQGRFTVIKGTPLMICDGAHNEDAWKNLTLSLNKYFGDKKFIYITGVLKDKEYDKMLDYIIPSMKYAVTVTPDNPRALCGRYLAQLIKKRGNEACFADSCEEALFKAKQKAEASDVIVVCGSLSFIGDILKHSGD